MEKKRRKEGTALSQKFLKTCLCVMTVCLYAEKLRNTDLILILMYILDSVAAPAQQRSQVISSSEHPRARSPGCTFFHEKVDDLFIF